MRMNLDVMQVPVITTAHLDAQTAATLTAQGDGAFGMTLAPYQEGFFIWAATESVSDNCPECLRAVCAWARRLGFDWVRLDSDGDHVVDLPTFEW